MKSIRQWWVGAAGAATLVAIIGAGAVMAQTPSTTPVVPGPSNASPAAPSTGNSTGTFKSNEDPTHEATETAQQEADEDAGRGRGGGKLNEDPAHESTETAAQEAAEDAGKRPAGTAPSGVPTTPGSNQTPSGTN